MSLVCRSLLVTAVFCSARSAYGDDVRAPLTSPEPRPSPSAQPAQPLLSDPRACPGDVWGLPELDGKLVSKDSYPEQAIERPLTLPFRMLEADAEAGFVRTWTLTGPVSQVVGRVDAIGGVTCSVQVTAAALSTTFVAPGLAWTNTVAQVQLGAEYAVVPGTLSLGATATLLVPAVSTAATGVLYARARRLWTRSFGVEVVGSVALTEQFSPFAQADAVTADSSSSALIQLGPALLEVLGPEVTWEHFTGVEEWIVTWNPGVMALLALGRWDVSARVVYALPGAVFSAAGTVPPQSSLTALATLTARF